MRRWRTVAARVCSGVGAQRHRVRARFRQRQGDRRDARAVQRQQALLSQERADADEARRLASVSTTGRYQSVQ
jgi:hypothetical protein